MIKIDDIIEKLTSIKEYYPDILVDADKLVVHISIQKADTELYLSIEKN